MAGRLKAALLRVDAFLMVHQVFNDAVEALLAGWHRYMDVVASTDDTFKLAEARRELDALRDRANRVRRAPTPEDRELEEGYLTAYCPFLPTTVYIPTADVRYTRDDTLEFDCACGRTIGHRPAAWLRDARRPDHTAPPHLVEAGRIDRPVRSP